MNGEKSLIRRNIEDLMKKIETAAQKSGRRAEDITVIAVTKTVEPERILKAVDLGLINLGENRVQELLSKYDKINEGIHWHLIGHLQTNKVKYIIDKVQLIHSLDRIELAEEIQKRALKAERVVDVLVQVNIAEEETKFGLAKEHVIPFMREISRYENIKVRGLMTIAPYAENPEEIRFVFRELRKLLINIREENIDNINMDFLSMGMSNDYEIAIEEGSNMVRIGTAIFGRRQ